MKTANKHKDKLTEIDAWLNIANRLNHFDIIFKAKPKTRIKNKVLTFLFDFDILSN